MDVRRMPVLYLSHGAPPLADDPHWPGQLSGLSATLPRPHAILIVSAHWEQAPVTLSATTTVPLVYDFWGFPERYYQVRYPAPGAPELAATVRKLLRSQEHGIADAPERGLDHGAYVPLVEMYPQADVPVLQLSMPTLDPTDLLRLGRRLAPLREQGVLIIGSGFATHNLRLMQPDADAEPPAWSAEFDHWLTEALRLADYDGLADFTHTAPAAALAHPRTEHFAPLFVAAGAGLPAGATAESVIDGYWHGLAKRSIQFA
ncbi:MAG: DODA-type extradiol aromatic ring-opening family dioxygenase [Sciscionella sp.]